jgi:hypothetical protein
LDCRHVCKTCAFHDALRAGKQKEVHPPYSPDLAPAGRAWPNHQMDSTTSRNSIPKSRHQPTSTTAQNSHQSCSRVVSPDYWQVMTETCRDCGRQ